jgi:hypothetical protein
MNVKPGDLAIVLNAKDEINKGATCHVISMRCLFEGDTYWRCEFPRPVKVRNRAELCNFAFVSDSHLRKIGGDDVIFDDFQEHLDAALEAAIASRKFMENKL